MTNTPNELERAVERLKNAARNNDGTLIDDDYGEVFVCVSDLHLANEILSERAELLATVERMREELDVAAVHLQIAGGWLREAGDDGQRTKELLRASNRARRAALTTGEEK